MTLQNNMKLTSAKKSTIEDRYNQLKGKREPFLSRARDFASFTLPHILPPIEEHSGNLGDGSNQYGWENIGSEATNHLSNKMASTMFPVAHDFFTLSFDTYAQEQLAKAGIEPSSLQRALTLAKNRAKEIEKKYKGRLAVYAVMEHLIVTGNVLLAFLDNCLQAIPLDRYVVRRDRAGNLQELIIKEVKAIESFPKKLRNTIKSLKKIRGKTQEANKADQLRDDEVALYTSAKLCDGNWIVIQEVEGHQVDKQQRVKDLPFWPLRWKHNYGEDYGRGLVENHAGDFFVVSFLSEAIVKGMTLMADVKYLIKPGSMIDIDEFVNSPTGEVLYGHTDDVTILQLDRFADFTPIKEVVNEYQRRIGRAFLMNSQVRRDAERVTTVELRMDAAELEGALGGVYTTLDVDMQTPLAKFYMSKVDLDIKEIGVEPEIKTGMDALGRSSDLENLNVFSELMKMPSSWDDGAKRAMKWPTYMEKVGGILGMDMGFIMTEKELSDSMAASDAAQTNKMAEEEMAKAAGQALPKIIEDDK